MSNTKTSVLSAINIKARIAKKLSNPAFRRRFFRARAQEEIAQQIRELRERRRMRQSDLARRAKMKQSAVSRIEQSGYSAWTYRTLVRVAEALDARLRIVFDAHEDVVAQYEREALEQAKAQAQAEADIAFANVANAIMGKIGARLHGDILATVGGSTLNTSLAHLSPWGYIADTTTGRVNPFGPSDLSGKQSSEMSVEDASKLFAYYKAQDRRDQEYRR